MSGDHSEAKEPVDEEAGAAASEARTKLHRAFTHKLYTFRRPFWSLTGRNFGVYAPTGSRVLAIKHPFLRLKEELQVFDDDEKTELLAVRETKIAIRDVRYDVVDRRSDKLVGSIVSRDFRSVARDAWDVNDANDKRIGMMEEGGRALLRRFVPIIKGQYFIEVDGQEGARIVQTKGTFSKEYVLDMSTNEQRLDPRLGIACTLLAMMAEPASS